MSNLFREIDKSEREDLIAKAEAIYAKHNFETLSVSRRIENLPPEGFNRGDSCILILRSIFGVDWEERVKVLDQCFIITHLLPHPSPTVMTNFE